MSRVTAIQCLQEGFSGFLHREIERNATNGVDLINWRTVLALLIRRDFNSKSTLIVAGAVGVMFAEQRAHQPQDNSLGRCETYFNTLLSAELDCCASELQMQIRQAAKQHGEKTQRRPELSEEQEAPELNR